MHARTHERMHAHTQKTSNVIADRANSVDSTSKDTVGYSSIACLNWPHRFTVDRTHTDTHTHTHTQTHTHMYTHTDTHTHRHRNMNHVCTYCNTQVDCTRNTDQYTTRSEAAINIPVKSANSNSTRNATDNCLQMFRQLCGEHAQKR